VKESVWAESTKFARSTVGIVATVAIVGGIAALCGGMLLAVASGDPAIIAKLGPAATADWTGLLAVAAQITGAGGLIGFGVVIAWLFGREFADGTITGLFALPAGRGVTASAKFVVFAVWALVVSAALALMLLVLGVVAGYGAPGPAESAGLGRQFVLGVATAAIAAPVAWAATASRSLLGGVSTAIGLLVVAQVSVIAGVGGWMPLAAPTLWAMSAGTSVSVTQAAVAAVFAGLAVALTVVTWRRLQLDR